jgi:maleylacetate reductase
MSRGETLYGAWLCGTVLGQVGMALHHKLCHTLGGSFDLPHAETHAVVLPHAIAFNAIAVPELLAPVTEIFGGVQSRSGACSISPDPSSAPLALRELGLKQRRCGQSRRAGHAQALLESATGHPAGNR